MVVGMPYRSGMELPQYSAISDFTDMDTEDLATPGSPLTDPSVALHSTSCSSTSDSSDSDSPSSIITSDPLEVVQVVCNSRTGISESHVNFHNNIKYIKYKIYHRDILIDIITLISKHRGIYIISTDI